jgi:hypothetical protein
LGNTLCMTRLTIVQAPALEFSVQGRNATTDAADEGLVFYNDVNKVHVLPDEQNFTIHLLTPDLEVQMDFPDAESVRAALELFEAKKVSEVHADAPGAVRLKPIESEAKNVNSVVEEAVDGVSSQADAAATIKPQPASIPEQMPSRPVQRPSENLPDTQKQ